jgi:hypothetical protein
MRKRTSTTNPYNYKTQNGLLKAISRWSDAGIFVWWREQNTKECLIEKWAWEERAARRYCNGFSSPVFYFCSGLFLI